MKFSVGVDNKTTSGNIKNVNAISKILHKMTGKNSISRMAQDTIFQFPLLMSSGIEDNEDKMIMAKGIEMQLAAFVTSMLSLRGSIPVNKYEDVQTYLKKFHNNSGIPTNIKVASDVVFESATFSNKEIPGLGAACWEDVEDQITMESLNDIYRPYDKTKATLKYNLQRAIEAAESLDKTSQKLKDVAKHLSDADYEAKSGGLSKDKTRQGVKGPTIAKSNNISALEPTLIDVQFVLHGDNKSWTQNVVLGVKTMVRIIRSDLMVSNMADASKDSYNIFKFIKWTKGEFKIVKDFIFGASELKDIATSSDNKWINALKKRKITDNISKWLGNRILPNTTIIMTSYEVEQVAGLTGVSLAEVHNALKLVSQFYLLGFGIYDNTTRSLSIIFEGDSDFSYITLNSLRSNNKKDVDLNNLKDVMKLMGRI